MDKVKMSETKVGDIVRFAGQWVTIMIADSDTRRFWTNRKWNLVWNTSEEWNQKVLARVF